MTSLATIKQKIHIFNTIIKPCKAYAYYVVPFFQHDIQKLDKMLSKHAKAICNIPKSTSNILTPSLHRGLWHQHNILLLDYIHYIGKQLLFVLNDVG